MKLYQQWVLFMLAATVLPLAVVGFWLLRESEAELSRRIAAEQRALSAAAAEGTAAQLMGAVDALSRSAELIRWSELNPEEVRGALLLLYQQAPLVSVVALAGGEGLSAPVFQQPGSAGHPGFDPVRGLPRLTQAMPLERLRSGQAGQVALSAAYLGSLGQPALAVAIQVGEADSARYVLAELGLEAVSAALRERAGEGRIELVDGAGRVIASSEPGQAIVELDRRLWLELQANLGAGSPKSFSVTLDQKRLVAASGLPQSLGLLAVASVAEREALSPVRDLRRTVLYSIGGALALLLALGLAFTRRLNARLERVTEGAEAFSRGELSRRLPVEGADELAELSRSFNHMGAELEAARGRLEKWNDELKQAVDEATAELKAAQEKLLEAQKLAAIGQLGAGVAHEINNPLCGILGNAQLMMLEREEGDPDLATLRKIEQSAKRCKEITENLLRFSQSQGPAELRPIDLSAIVQEAVELNRRQAPGDGVSLSLSLASEPLWVKADPAQLVQVALALFTNARTAMAGSQEKRLSITTCQEGEEAVLKVKDTGKGIKPEHVGRIFEPFFTTKDVWSNVGLGLSVGYRILSEHQGRIEVATELGKGSCFTVRLPLRSPDASEGRAPQIGGRGAGILG